MRCLLVLVLLCGCAGSRQITNLSEVLPDQEASHPHHATVDTVLSHYLTPEAYEAVKDIPLIDGPALSGYAAGTTFFSNLMTLITFNGWGRKVVFPASIIREQWGVEGVLHEYIHHLDDMDRNGTHEFLDHEEFRQAFIRLEQDFIYAWLAINANRKHAEFSWLYHEFFSVGDLSERIAYVAAQVAVTGKGPPYLKQALSRILRLP